jgi:hypothetical protein
MSLADEGRGLELAVSFESLYLARQLADVPALGHQFPVAASFNLAGATVCFRGFGPSCGQL